PAAPSRRFRRKVGDAARGGPRPDLSPTDGAEGPLASAGPSQTECGLGEIPIRRPSKRIEEIFLPNQADPILLPKTSAALQLLQQVRDEAHRFAITFQRGKRKARLVQSWLDEIPGIGDKTKMKLLRAFKSPVAVREATG